jgi:hypothetical protein
MTTAKRRAPRPPDGGDIVVGALARVLDRVCDRLAAQGLADAADLVADLADAAHDYVACPRHSAAGPGSGRARLRSPGQTGPRR